MDAANVAAQSGDFWTSVGPYLMAACGVLIGAVWVSFREDIKWLKKNLTKVLVKLQIEPEGD